MKRRSNLGATETQAQPLFLTSGEEVTAIMERTARAGAISFDDVLQLSAAGITAPGHGILEIIGRHLGLSNVQSVSVRVKHGMVTSSILLEALQGFEPPSPEEAGALTPEAIFTLSERVRGAATILQAAIAEHGQPVRAAQSVVRQEDEDEGDEAA